MTNSVDPRTVPEPDAHGRAALLLVESLIHGLVARSALTTEEALEITEIALNTQEELNQEPPGASVQMNQARSLLASIGASLASDLRG